MTLGETDRWVAAKSREAYSRQEEASALKKLLSQAHKKTQRGVFTCTCFHNEHD